MNDRIINIDREPLASEPSVTGGRWQYIDLGGEHLGARIEVLDPGDVSSYHHYHTREEEHVLVLSGLATLHRGDARQALGPGDHVWFAAGDETPHHLSNPGPGPLRFLVFGERDPGDVVIYPDAQYLMLKSPRRRLVSYRDRPVPGAEDMDAKAADD